MYFLLIVTKDFLSISSTFYAIAYPLNALFFFATLNSSLKGSSESKSMFFKCMTLGFSMYVL